jgi:hypothetical protein
MAAQYTMFVWWGTPVEVNGAFTRLLRMKQLTSRGQVQAQVAFERLRGAWHELRPSDEIRAQAERLIQRFPLRAADALQLAAAHAWTLGRPRGRVFISGDNQLLEAAGQLGFLTLKT